MPRGERKIHNQALFRSVNERIAELAAKFGEQADAGLLSFVCECPQIGCRAFIRAPLEVYEHMRNDPALFLVLKGHEDGREPIVADLGDYLIVGGDESAVNRQDSAAAADEVPRKGVALRAFGSFNALAAQKRRD
jgi:uncharacterized Zn finger protein